MAADPAESAEDIRMRLSTMYAEALVRRFPASPLSMEKLRDMIDSDADLRLIADRIDPYRETKREIGEALSGKVFGRLLLPGAEIDQPSRESRRRRRIHNAVRESAQLKYDWLEQIEGAERSGDPDEQLTAMSALLRHTMDAAEAEWPRRRRFAIRTLLLYLCLIVVIWSAVAADVIPWKIGLGGTIGLGVGFSIAVRRFDGYDY